MYFWWLQEHLLKTTLLKLARASAILMKKIITQGILTKDMLLRERKLIFIESLSFYFLAFFICRKCDTPNVNFYLPTKKRFL